MSTPILSIRGLSKTYDSGHQALRMVDLDVRRGEIFALLGPNGAGKTTLIGIVCGLIRATTGTVLVDGHDNVTAFRQARARIGLVPQEISTDMFETIWDTVTFSRGLFGKPRNPALLEQILRDLSLWDKRDQRIMTLSGGMKRRVLIAKALSHEPDILFLDEPTAGVDVELRRDMWEMVSALRAGGTTIILTTHYIEEAEEMADRVGVIDRGQLMLVEEKGTLMARLGTTTISVALAERMERLPDALIPMGLALSEDGLCLRYVVHGDTDTVGVTEIVRALDSAGIGIRSIETRRSSLEDIFVELVGGGQ